MLSNELRKLPGSAKGALICGLLPFFVGFSIWERRAVGGVATESYFDIGAAVLGVAAVGYAVLGVYDLRKRPWHDAMRTYAICLCGAALGVLHLSQSYGVEQIVL